MTYNMSLFELLTMFSVRDVRDVTQSESAAVNVRDVRVNVRDVRDVTQSKSAAGGHLLQ
jgi:hypothetical protein